MYKKPIVKETPEEKGEKGSINKNTSQEKQNPRENYSYKVMKAKFSTLMVHNWIK